MRLSRGKDRLKQVVSSTLARNTLWSILGQGGRLVLQTLYFVTITRALGVDNYGMLVASMSLISIVVPFAGWGSGNVLIMQVAREPADFSEYWGNALATILLSGTLFSCVMVLFAHQLLPEFPIELFIMLSLADLFLARVVETASQAFQGLDRLVPAVGLGLLPQVLRVVAAVALIKTTQAPDALDWALWYLGATLCSCLMAGAVVTYVLGRPTLQWATVRASLKPGALFAISLSSSSIYTDVDKVMLARLATLEATGVYAAGYRVVSMAFIPVRSLLYATYGRFFRHGSKGIGGTILFARSLLPVALAWSLLAGGALLLFAPVVPILLGEEYQNAIDTIRWLAVLPLIQSVHYLGADTLTGAGHQGIRSVIQIGIALLNVVLNLILIPSYGWRGAVWATLGAELCMAALIWLAVLMIFQRTVRAVGGLES